MARYLGPKAKLSRREGTDLFLKSARRSLADKAKSAAPMDKAKSAAAMGKSKSSPAMGTKKKSAMMDSGMTKSPMKADTGSKMKKPLR